MNSKLQTVNHEVTIGIVTNFTDMQNPCVAQVMQDGPSLQSLARVADLPGTLVFAWTYLVMSDVHPQGMKQHRLAPCLEILAGEGLLMSRNPRLEFQSVSVR